MDYNLAKKLKEAGFPQDKCNHYWVTSEEHKEPAIAFKNEYYSLTQDKRAYMDGYDDSYMVEELVAAPTLEELILACGEKFWGIEKAKSESKFYASGWQELGAEFIGETPEEAVANLWMELKLNKKP